MNLRGEFLRKALFILISLSSCLWLVKEAGLVQVILANGYVLCQLVSGIKYFFFSFITTLIYTVGARLEFMFLGIFC